MRITAAGPRARVHRVRRSGSESGIALITVLSIVFVISLLAVLVMYLTGKELISGRQQLTATDAFYLADGGATTAREATYQLVENLGTNATVVAGGSSVLQAQMATMYGTSPTLPSQQNPLKIFDYAGFKSGAGACCSTITFNSTTASTSIVYSVINQVTNYPTMYLEAYPGSDQFLTLGDGSYATKITITPRVGGSGLYIDQSGPTTVPTYTFHFTYTILSRGVSLQATRQVQLSKNFDVVVTPGSFADYAYFLNFFGQAPSGGSCSSGGYFTTADTFNGPVHTNGRMQLAGDPTFNGPVEQADYSFSYSSGQCVTGAQAAQGLVHFYNNGNPQDQNYWCSPPPPANPSCTVDNPTYAQGGSAFNRLASLIPMPTNAFSQVRAAIGGNPNTTTTVTNQEINQDLGLCSSSCSSNPPPNGTYLPSTTSGSTKTLTGGIYIQDNNLTGMSFSLDSNGNQVTTITQSSPSSGVRTLVTTITVNQGSNQTVVATQSTANGGSVTNNSTTYAGQPNGMVYTSGSIAALGGRTQTSSSSCPSDSTDLGQNSNNTNLVGSCIQSNTAMTVAAGGDINVNENLRYQTEPVSSGTQPNNILGIYSAGGNVNINQAPTNLETDAFMMSATGMIQVNNYGSISPGNWSLLGGKIANYAGFIGTFRSCSNPPSNLCPVSGYSTTMTFDSRTINNGIVPPFFPVASNYSANFPGLIDSPANHATWQEVF
jgi:hypothetical protein